MWLVAISKINCIFAPLMKARKVYYLALFIFVSLSACGLKPSKHGKLIGGIHAYQEQKGGLAEQNGVKTAPKTMPMVSGEKRNIRFRVGWKYLGN